MIVRSEELVQVEEKKEEAEEVATPSQQVTGRRDNQIVNNLDVLKTNMERLFESGEHSDLEFLVG